MNQQLLYITVTFSESAVDRSTILEANQQLPDLLIEGNQQLLDLLLDVNQQLLDLLLDVNQQLLLDLSLYK